MHVVRLSREEIRQIRRQVLVQNSITHEWVKGKGFSLAELQEAGLNPIVARKMGLPIDKRRKSMHEHNVNLLRRIIVEKLGQKVAEAKVEAVSTEAEEKPTRVAKPITQEEAIEAVVGAVIEFLDGANRRKREKILEVFVGGIKEKMPDLASKGEEELSKMLENLLNDLSMAGLGKLSKAFFTKSRDWDVSTAREIMTESLKRLLKGE